MVQIYPKCWPSSAEKWTYLPIENFAYFEPSWNRDTEPFRQGFQMSLKMNDQKFDW